MDRKIMIALIMVSLIIAGATILTFTAVSAAGGNQPLFKSWRTLIGPVLDLQARVSELEEKNALLEERVAELEGLLDDGVSTEIMIELDDIEYGQGDVVEISGNVDDAQDGDEVEITIHTPDGGSDNADTEISNDDGDFDSVYEISDSADDGIYQVEVEFGTEDPVFTFFLVDEEEDAIEVETDQDIYEPGDEVAIAGEVQDPVTGVDEVEITVIAPSGDEILSSEDVDLDVVEFELEFELDDDLSGRYAVIVEYDDEEGGFSIFEVEEGGSSIGEFVSAELSKTSYKQGEKVIVTGAIAEDDVDIVEVLITVDDPSGDEIFDDSVRPENDGSFEFSCDLDDEAATGSYEVTLSYEGYDDEVLTFSVTNWAVS